MSQQKYGYLGADVSKGYCDWILLDAQKKWLCAPFQLDDNREGHRAISQFIRSSLKEHGLSGIYCGVESTGGYENNWLNLLHGLGRDLPVQARRVNPKAVRHEAEADLKRTVTDPVSAHSIALYLIHRFEHVFSVPNGTTEYQSARSLYGYIQLLIKQNSGLKNQLEKLVYQAFPELLSLISQWPQWSLKLLERYPTAEALRDVSLEDLYKISHFPKKKAVYILGLAQKSVAGKSDQLLAFTIRSLCHDILQNQGRIEEHKAFMATEVKDPQRDLLLSIKGIGLYLATGLILEIEDVTRFQDARKVAAYFGVNPSFKQSGDGKWSARMSKQGRASARYLLYLAAQNATRFESYFKAYYERFRAKGKGHNAAMGVVMHKLLRVIYGMLKNKQPFDPNVDETQVKTSIARSKTTQDKKKTSRRYQQKSTEAPISRREKARRKQET